MKLRKVYVEQEGTIRKDKTGFFPEGIEVTAQWFDHIKETPYIDCHNNERIRQDVVKCTEHKINDIPVDNFGIDYDGNITINLKEV